MKTHPAYSIIVAVLSLAFPVESVVLPVLIGRLARHVVDGASRATIAADIFMIALLNIIVLCLYNLDLYVSQMFSVSMATVIQRQLLRFIFITRKSGVETLNAPELALKIRSYTNFMSKRINLIRNHIVPSIASLVFESAYLIYKYDYALGLAIVIVMATIFCSMYYALTVKNPLATFSTNADEASICRVADVLENFPTIIDHEGVDYEMRSLGHFHNRCKNTRSNAVMFSLRFSSVVNGAAAVVSAFYGWRVYSKFLVAGTNAGKKTEIVTTTATILMSALSTTRSVMYHLYELSYGQAGLKSVKGDFFRGVQADVASGTPTLSEDQECSVSSNALHATSAVSSSPQSEILRTENLSFSYTASSHQILKDLNISFAKGSKTIIIGRNGAGKSTLMKLLMRHAMPTSGEIYLDGVAYSTLSPEQIRRKIAYSSQVPILFNRSVVENIAYGKRPHASREEVIDHIASLGLNDFFERLPNGIDTIAGRLGTNLSGGQRQIVQLARILIQPDTQIVILDEVTAAVDVATRALIVSLIKSDKFANKTIIAVTHDRELMSALGDNCVTL